MKKFAKVVGTVAFGVAILAGCGAVDGESGYEDPPATVSENTPGDTVDVFKKEVENGQTVDCVYVNGYREGGLSCNWEKYNAEYGVKEKSN